MLYVCVNKSDCVTIHPCYIRTWCVFTVPLPSPPLRSTSLPTSALHVAIINNHTDAVRALLDVLPQLPPTQTPVVDTQNHLHQVCTQELMSGASGWG